MGITLGLNTNIKENGMHTVEQRELYKLCKKEKESNFFESNRTAKMLFNNQFSVSFGVSSLKDKRFCVLFAQYCA